MLEKRRGVRTQVSFERVNIFDGTMADNKGLKIEGRGGHQRGGGGGGRGGPSGRGHRGGPGGGRGGPAGRGTVLVCPCLNLCLIYLNHAQSTDKLLSLQTAARQIHGRVCFFIYTAFAPYRTK